MSSYIFKVTKFEIMRQLKKPAFWAATLLIPIMIGAIYLISFISSNGNVKEPEYDNNTKIAILDESGVLSSDVPFLIEGSKEDGIGKVKNGEATYFFYIPADFADSKKTEFYHISEGLEIFNNDASILKSILLKDASTRTDAKDVLALSGNYEITDHKLSKDGSDANALGRAIIPFFIGIMFFMFVTLCGNRFLFTVIEEKENRISEMILTAISSKHLIIGKIIALLTLGLIQIAAIVIPVLLLIFANRDNEFVSGLLNIIVVDPVSITLSLLLFIASSVFYAGVCTFVGSLVSTARDASSFIGPAIIAMVLPLYFMSSFMATEPTFIVQFLTYFPFTAPIALVLRNGFGTITTPEFCLGIGVVVISSIVAIYFAIRSFQKNSINFGLALPKFLRSKK
ncbi:ABC transporter permease [Candidatus Saccharibacteria bacterium]|nr:ABC transporter permease [Candidatus Saccharibacteria bacterium]